MGTGVAAFGGDGRVNVKMVADDDWVNPCSIEGVPCKHVNIPFKNLDQPFLLLKGQLCPHLKELL